MSHYVFRGNSYEKLMRSSKVSVISKELVYRKKPALDPSENIIRSQKTAQLLQLETRPKPGLRLVYRGCVVSPQPSVIQRRRSIQPGGFIRSRMTAELIGVNPSSSSPCLTVREGGILRSRRLAALIGVESSAMTRKRVYRGVEY